MAEPSTQSLTMAADPAAIMAAIADFRSYPEWAGAVKTVEVTDPGQGGRAAQVRFSMDAGPIKDTYELAYQWAADDRSVSWTLVKGQLQKAQRGSYVLRPVAPVDGAPHTEVVYTLAVDLSIPLIGVFRRKAEKVVMDTALKELRKRVEATGAGTE
ncbi:SRPBCC family protein [Nakamurella flavida]|uniref:SRPBCC family protein n=1 Tax=Nakamurella flavida TaxID=363630 RepID=A0A938YJZ2_9ACTN|nr:SRPBCC family protein [Nakamurella flavida]MBM9476088.1 SRPBCC family protein [Nakamurella flavida]MDP9777167.1 ribosome-associated toxin RatA of RatAB toxin-antitoxin module [Nakamurella flavida]